MKGNFWESVLFLIVGFLAAAHGASDLINANYQNVSIWLIAWSVFRLVAGLMALILGLKGIFKNRT